MKDLNGVRVRLFLNNMTQYKNNKDVYSTITTEYELFKYPIPLLGHKA